MAMRSLTPQIKAIQERYAGDQVTTFPFFVVSQLLFKNGRLLERWLIYCRYSLTLSCEVIVFVW